MHMRCKADIQQGTAMLQLVCMLQWLGLHSKQPCTPPQGSDRSSLGLRGPARLQMAGRDGMPFCGEQPTGQCRLSELP